MFAAQDDARSGHAARFLYGLFFVSFGIGAAAFLRFLVVPSYCTQRADGTYGELYGPVHFFSPYIYGASIVLVSIGLFLLVWACKAKRTVVTPHA
jgi:hypothetical protein